MSHALLSLRCDLHRRLASVPPDSADSRSDHHGARAQHQRCGDPTCVPDASGRDHRNRDRIDDSRHEREQTHQLLFSLVRVKGAAMSACLHTLRENGVGACLFGRPRFRHPVVAVANHRMPVISSP